MKAIAKVVSRPPSVIQNGAMEQVYIGGRQLGQFLQRTFFFDDFFFIANYLFFVPAIFLGPYCEHNFFFFS